MKRYKQMKPRSSNLRKRKKDHNHAEVIRFVLRRVREGFYG